MLTLREMMDMATGEVWSKTDQIEKGRREKPPRPAHWLTQQERILQHRKQVVKLVENEIERRKAEGEAA